MSTEQPAQDPSPSAPVERGDWPAPGATVKRGNLTIRNLTGLARWPATGRHRVVNRCRAGHSETIEVHTERDLIAAMTAGCRVVMPDGQGCRALVNCSRHVGPDGVEIGMIWIPDPRTPPDSPEAAR
jgi:hypothetical protein